MATVDRKTFRPAFDFFVNDVCLLKGYLPAGAFARVSAQSTGQPCTENAPSDRTVARAPDCSLRLESGGPVRVRRSRFRRAFSRRTGTPIPIRCMTPICPHASAGNGRDPTRLRLIFLPRGRLAVQVPFPGEVAVIVMGRQQHRALDHRPHLGAETGVFRGVRSTMLM